MYKAGQASIKIKKRIHTVTCQIHLHPKLKSWFKFHSAYNKNSYSAAIINVYAITYLKTSLKYSGIFKKKKTSCASHYARCSATATAEHIALWLAQD